MFTMIQLIVMQLSLKTVIVGKYHDLANSGVNVTRMI